MDRGKHRLPIPNGAGLPGTEPDHLLGADRAVFPGAGRDFLWHMEKGAAQRFAVRRGIPGVYLPFRLDDQRGKVYAVLRAAVYHPGQAQGGKGKAAAVFGSLE